MRPRSWTRRVLCGMAALVVGAGVAHGEPTEASAPATVDDRPRIGSVKWRTWIWPTPERGKNHLAIGAVRIGTAVRLASERPVSGNKWFAVEPFGYVFADDTTTRDFESPYWKALASLAPKPGAWPYRYGFSTGAPMYSRIPTPAEQRSAEHALGPVRTFRPLGKWSESHEVLLMTDQANAIVATDPVPGFLRGHEPIAGGPWNPANPKVQLVPAGSGVAWARAFSAAGRVWLLTPDLLLVPADRVFPYVRSDFAGVELAARHTLPLAWVRGKSTPKLRREGDRFVETGESWPSKSHLLLADEEIALGSDRFRKTRERDGASWVKLGGGLSVVEPVRELRFGIRRDERWLQASITRGTMVAYVGLEPVWTTLWSGGKGGVPVPGNDPKRFATTELGIFPIQWKDEVATMSPDKGSPTVFWFPDVPHIQYVHAPLALHVSYWHDNFGYLMSAECLNISAADGKWLFDFTLPKVPAGWNSVGPHKLVGESTKIHIIP